MQLINNSHAHEDRDEQVARRVAKHRHNAIAEPFYDPRGNNTHTCFYLGNKKLGRVEGIYTDVDAFLYEQGIMVEL